MGFVHSTFLAALIGAGLPVLIHLLTRDRIRRVDFSSLRFFVKNSRAVLRRRRVREMILLAMRILACALLAMAFARPIFGTGPEKDAVGGKLLVDRAVVVVLDRSGSMADPAKAQMAQEKALAAVSGLSRSNAAAAVVSFADTASVDVALTADIDAVEAAIIAAAPGHGATDIAEALRLANEQLQLAGSGKKTVVLVSDLQRSGWQGFRGDWRLLPGAELTLQNIAPDTGAGNVAIVDADCPESMVRDNAPRTIAARVANYTAKDVANLKVTLEVNGERVDTQSLNIPAGKTAPVRFRVLFERAGDNIGSISAIHDDALPGDNTYHFNVRVIPRIGVLIVNGKPSRNPATDAAFFIRTALAPVQDAAFAVSTVEADQLNAQSFEGISVVILANVLTVDAETRGQITQLLERGGGVLFLPGDKVNPDIYNRVFADIAPCRLRRQLIPRARAGQHPEAVLTKVDFEHSALHVFQQPHHGDLGLIKFYKYWEVSDSQLASIHARFDDGRPAIVERQIGSGISMLFASPVDLAWTDLPRRAVYLPLLHQLIRYLAIRTEQKTSFTVGTALPVPEGGSVQGSNGAQTGDDAGGAAIATAPGAYSLMDAQGRVAHTVAVNQDFQESDPAAVDPAEIIAAVTSTVDSSDDGTQGSAAARLSKADKHHVWWYLTLAIALLMLGELFLAGKTQRH